MLAALANHLEDADFEQLAGGTVTFVVRLGEHGVPKRISVKTELERPVLRLRSDGLCGIENAP